MLFLITISDKSKKAKGFFRKVKKFGKNIEKIIDNGSPIIKTIIPLGKEIPTIVEIADLLINKEKPLNKTKMLKEEEKIHRKGDEIIEKIQKIVHIGERLIKTKNQIIEALNELPNKNDGIIEDEFQEPIYDEESKKPSNHPFAQ